MLFDHSFDTIYPDLQPALTIGGTGALLIPSGTTAQRPTPSAGHIRYNTDTGLIEVVSSSGEFRQLRTCVSLVDDNITATGTSLATAYEITSDVNTVTTTPSNSGVRLPLLTESDSFGVIVTVYNFGANPLNVYPPSGTSIYPQSTNTPLIIPPQEGSLFVLNGGSTGTWLPINPFRPSGVASISGTTNQITASGSTGAITLSLPSTLVTPGDVRINGALSRSSEIKIAAGTTYATAVQLTDDIIVIGCFSPTSNGVILPQLNPTTGFARDLQLTNIGTDTATIYPFGTDEIYSIANATISTYSLLPSHTVRMYGTTSGWAISQPQAVYSTGIGITLTAEGDYEISNTGVTSVIAGSGISVSSATGAVTISNTGVTSVAASGGTTGLSFSGSPITTTGTLTLSGTLVAANGGTGLSSLGTSNQFLAINTGGTALEYKTVSAGTGISVTPGAGTLSIANTGVTSVIAGSGISVSSATGAVTISASGGSGTVTSVALSGGTTGLTSSGGPITGSGTLTLSGTLVAANGGTGLSSIGTSNQLLAVNTGGSALEYKTVSAGTGISVTPGAGTLSIANTGVTSVAASGGTTGLSFSGSPITTTGTLTLSGTLAVANGGTGAATANLAFNALAPSQASNSGKFLTTNGTDTSWATVSAAPAGSSTQIQYNSSGAFAGSAGLTWVDASSTLALVGTDTGIQLTSVTNDPTTPPALNGRLYAKNIAGRIVPKWVGPSGLDYPLQSTIAQNNIRMWRGGATTTATTFAGQIGVMPYTGASPTAPTIPTLASTNIRTSTSRSVINTGATAGALAYIRGNQTRVWRGNAAGLGGFHVVVRFGMSVLQAGNRIYAGLQDTAANPTNVDPTTTTTPGKIGMGIAANTGNWRIIHNVTGTAPTTIDLGASFAINATDLLELVLFAAPNASSVGYRVTNFTSNAVASGTLSTNLPANTTFLAPTVWVTNNATAASASLDFVSYYIETDY